MPEAHRCQRHQSLHHERYAVPGTLASRGNEEHTVAKRSKPPTIEYAFRFAHGTDAERTRMAEMIRVNLQALVEQVILTHHGQEVTVDGFRLRDEPETTYDLAHAVSQGPQRHA
jgi:hypothetical protein